MRVVVAAVGKVKGPVATAVAEYERRARRYWKLEVLEVAPGARGATSRDAVRESEGTRLLSGIPAGLELIALTREGDAWSSEELAAFLERGRLHASPGVAFVVGGAFGLSPAVLERSRKQLTLGPVTLPHDMARLVVLEQLYRAGTILRGEPYHKG